MGALQVLDAAVPRAVKGRIPFLPLIFSLSEYWWAFVSFRVWQTADPALPLWLPLSFVAYVVTWFVIGLALASRRSEPDFAVPTWVTIGGGIFGLYFAVAAASRLAG
jgi:hypothetical protein